jgi:hypothetical protein
MLFLNIYPQISLFISHTFSICPASARQGKKGERRSKMESLISLFGERFSYRWFLPLRATKQCTVVLLLTLG